MARKYLTPIDLTGLELQNAKIQNLASNPSAYGKGHVYFNTAANELRVYDGTNWIPVGGSLEFGNTVSRPAAGNAGRSYADTQTGTLYVDNGTSWVQIGINAGDLSSAISAATPTSTDQISEGTTNLYYLDSRARAAISGSGAISYDSSTGIISVDYTTLESQLVTDGFATASSTTEFSNKSFSDSITVGGAVYVGGTTNHGLDVDGSGNTELGSTTGIALSANNNITLTSSDGDIVLNPDGDAYIGSVTDAHRIATRSYVDGVAQGLNVKNSVAAATTANIAFDGSVSTLDGHTVVTGDRILVKNQSTASQNGIYVASTTGAWTRATDEQTPAKGDFVFVESGTANGKTGWILSDTTGGNYTWTQFSAAGEYTAGNGIDISGNSIAAVVNTAAGMALDADGIAINAGSGLEFDGSTGALKVTGFSTLASKFSGNVGNGTLTSIPITHGLGTKDVQVSVYEVLSGDEVIVDITRTSNNVVTLGFAVAPTTNAYRVVVIA